MIPKTLLIGNIPYEIKVVKGWIEENRTEILQGQIRYDEQLIEVSGKLSEEKLIKVLIHEITHGILEEYGMVKHNKEDFVDRLSAALYDFLTRNNLSFLQPENNAHETQNSSTSSKLIKLLATEPKEAVYQQVPLSSAPISESDDRKKEEKAPSRPRRLPLLSSGGTTSFPIRDIAKVSQDEPDHWRTGIKVIDGEKHYKTRYQCPECGNKGTRYLPEDYQYVICHSCDEEIQKIPATKEGFPHRDSWGNYFVTAGVNTNERD
ncbi:hypothetical protein [Ornithinibacillus sp. JPR2-1]|uniref:hypothetical protein n=1 Tax=Ornithinibacillus sp. JPR2-1 TaxID=2094019 RepID=UPI0031D8E4AE